MEHYHTAIYENLRLLVQIYPNLDKESRLQESMFKRPNTRGMQSVFHSLMMILNPEYCQLHVPWPISFQSDSYKFRTSLINFIKTECPDFEAPQLMPSLLNKADGDKFVRLVFDFVSYVTKCILQRKKVAVLNMPNASIDEDESNCSFECVTSSNHKYILAEKQSSLRQHKEMMKTSSTFISYTDKEKKQILKEIHSKKESSHEELKHLLSYTDINDKHKIEFALSDSKDVFCEMQRNYSLVLKDTRRILTKKENLLRLIHLQENFEGSLIHKEYLKSNITDMVASKLNVPLDTILSSLFVNSESDTLISLKHFLHFGYLLLKSRQQKFLELKVPDQHRIVQEATEILRNVTEKVDELKHLNEALEKEICECKRELPNLQNPCQENITINNDCVEIMRLLLSMKNYCPKPLTQLPERSLFCEVSEELESNEEIMNQLKNKMKIETK